MIEFSNKFIGAIKLNLVLNAIQLAPIWRKLINQIFYMKKYILYISVKIHLSHFVRKPSIRS